MKELMMRIARHDNTPSPRMFGDVKHRKQRSPVKMEGALIPCRVSLRFLACSLHLERV